jgi:O-antigen/teichoic acid export membrane protein
VNRPLRTSIDSVNSLLQFYYKNFGNDRAGEDLVSFPSYWSGMTDSSSSLETSQNDFGSRVKSAVLWRSGTQIISQLASWIATFAVIRLLTPGDYGLFAMTSVILVFMNFLNGYGLASALIQSEKVDSMRIRQALGLLILMNAGLAVIQFFAAPLAAIYYREPQVAQMLRWQSLIYLATPFLVLPEALVSRNLEFRKPAMINLTTAMLGAILSFSLAWNGFGVWTLVWTPIILFWVRAIMLVSVTRFFYWPSFNFTGTGSMIGFAATVLVAQGFWIVQSQSDLFIAGRAFNIHQLGLYAEALFLTQIFAAKFVPPLNEVAFPAYSRLQHDPSAMAYSFLKAMRLIMLIACPLYAGLSVTAGPVVATLMGPKWLEAIPLIQILALAMPFMTLQILFGPPTNALGKPKITMQISMFGAILMPVIFLLAVPFGTIGLAWGWLSGLPILLLFTIWHAGRRFGITLTGVIGACWPGFGSAALMAIIVWVADRFLFAHMPGHGEPLLKLAALVGIGGVSYAAILWFMARGSVLEFVELVRKRDHASV